MDAVIGQRALRDVTTTHRRHRCDPLTKQYSDRLVRRFFRAGRVLTHECPQRVCRAGLHCQGTVLAQQLQNRPVLRVGELFEMVLGLVCVADGH
jgi:hypothetical protein